ncbi:hypothetical protein KIW84_051170 [Lathyrus oleraceus]|uniref:Uncharacterized protein n=1 Tax=Pisum sativum TaxID=3888 RepID=A0A9D4WNF3_PEA|nr:hypothetical protein KIW84_051170 [Pisum sativum]
MKRVPNTIDHVTKKEKEMSDLMNGTPDSPDDDCWTPYSVVSPEHSKKRRVVVPYADDSEMQDGTKSISGGKGSNTTKSSFNIGDRIHRAASQLTASSSILKCSSDQSPKTDGNVDVFPENELDVSLPSVEDDQITRILQKKGEQPVAAKSPKPAAAKSPKPAKVHRPYNKKKVTDINHAETTKKPPSYIHENAPAELVMNFAEFNSVPSETNLNKMFKHFGPLKESKTEVDRVSSRAKVVFKKCVDAEVTFSSAKNFNIFGSVLVNYQLNYTPSALFKASSVEATQNHVNANLIPTKWATLQ